MSPRTSIVCLRSLAALAVVTVFAALASAQQYETDPNFDPKARSKQLTAQRSVKDAAEFARSQADFTEFFTKYYFPAMTRTEPEALGELGKLRYELFSKYLWASQNKQLKDQLTQLARKEMGKQVLNTAYHPAVRYNAVLVLGMLDADFDGKNTPTPLPQATKVLKHIVDNGMTSDKFPPALVLGALVGLERHAQYRDKLDPADIGPVTATLVKLVNEEKPIQQMDPEAYAWLRLRAASVLAQLGNAGPQGEVNAAIMKLLANDKSLDNRTTVAALLGKITYKDAKIDGKATVDSMLKLSGELAAAEGKRAKDFESAGVGGFSASPEFATSFDPNVAQRFPRQQVLARLQGLRRGLAAVKPALDEKQQAQLAEVDKAIDPVIKAAANKDIGDLALTGTIGTMARNVAALMPTAAPPEGETPAEESEDPLAPAADAPVAAEGGPPAADPPAAAEEPAAEAAPQP